MELEDIYFQKFKKFIDLQGVDINDKHLEVVVRQMTRKIKVDESGDTELLPGTFIDMFDFDEENARVKRIWWRRSKGRRNSIRYN